MSKPIEAHITGNVWKILVKAGDKVTAGQTLVIFESMKMEIPLEAEDPGTVVDVKIKEGQAVTEGDVVILFDET